MENQSLPKDYKTRLEATDLDPFEPMLANSPAPRVNAQDIRDDIIFVRYLRPGMAIDPCVPNHLDTITLCFITVLNGFTVIGKSACVDPANYDAEIGKNIAYEDAFNQLWALFGFQLATQLRDQGLR